MKKFLSTNLFFFIVLFSIVFIVYGKSVNFGLSNLDDDILTIKNIDYISNVKNIPKFFLKDCFFCNDTPYYRPVLNISFAVESVLFKYNTKVYHLTNILLFIISLYCIFVFLSKLNIDRTFLKFFILLFAVHPIFSSVLVWIPARNDSLLTIFFILSLINFFDYLKTNKSRNLIIHLLFFALALFSKETTLILLLIYPLFIYCFNLKINRKQAFINLFFVAVLVAVYFILRNLSVRSVTVLSIQTYIKNIVVGIMLYIEKLIYPTSMQIMLYDIKPTLQTYVINCLVIIPLIFIYLKKIIDRKIFVFAVLFSLLAILPTFAQEEYAFLTHRLIISLTGIIIIATTILKKITDKYPVLNKYLIVIFIFVMLLFSFCSFVQIDKYRNSLVFWTNAYKDAPTYYVCCNGLAKENVYIGNYTVAKNLYYESKRNKNTYDADVDICTTLILEGNVNEAKEKLLKLLDVKEKVITLRYLSEIYYVEGDIEKSIEFAKRAYKVDKKDELLLKHIKRLPDFDYSE